MAGVLVFESLTMLLHQRGEVEVGLKLHAFQLNLMSLHVARLVLIQLVTRDHEIKPAKHNDLKCYTEIALRRETII